MTLKWLAVTGCLFAACACSCSNEPASSTPASSTPASSTPASSTNEKPKDYWNKPFKKMVILGESTVAGGPWLRSSDETFADILARLIGECQLAEIEYVNKGIGGDCISPRSPGYERSHKPSAMARYREDVIDHQPDLFILCYGLNDMNAAMPIDQFVEDMQTIITAVKSECQPVIVLTTVFHMTAYRSPPTHRGSIEATQKFNRAIRLLAKKNDCLLADVWEAQGKADWLLHLDGNHPNKLGNFVIAHCVFNTIARNCSGMSALIFDRDLQTDDGKANVQARDRVGDPFDPWWRRE